MYQRAYAADMPTRMEQLRVSTEEDEPTEPITVLRNLIVNSSYDNIPLNYLSPTISASPSPDEMIIRQRGRRARSFFWSPEKVRDSVTPVKSTMTLRSSPRKRLYPADGTPDSSDESKISPRKSLFIQLRETIPGGKKLKFDDKPIAQTNTGVPLTETLKGYTQDQLIAIIGGLIKEQPMLEQKIRNELPIPDISQMEEQLNIANKNIYRSLPQSRLAKKTDGISYSRAVTHMNTFKKTIMDHTTMLSISENWDALLDYTLMAWAYVRTTPVWDNNSHNACRRYLFKTLASHLFVSLKRGGALLGEDRISRLSYRITGLQNDFNDLQINSFIELLNNIHETFN
ncbi:hypothetical protein Bhyg_15567 [Pseudolycoriella hygida]|uniref:Uncharacterized protein n=1 Tax=Pseudolycoriella hygida TaxID=35572 RepID=A0A9Q0RVH5_9DIPT|nr:hypothetical protein Bhyg_15567 [Pseudolycoriella hygida]